VKGMAPLVKLSPRASTRNTPLHRQVVGCCCCWLQAAAAASGRTVRNIRAAAGSCCCCRILCCLATQPTGRRNNKRRRLMMRAHQSRSDSTRNLQRRPGVKILSALLTLAIVEYGNTCRRAERKQRFHDQHECNADIQNGMLRSHR